MLILYFLKGTGIEYWSPTAAISSCKQTPPSPTTDSTLYNGFIAPFAVGPMPLKSFIWYVFLPINLGFEGCFSDYFLWIFQRYQGESNTCPQEGPRPCGREYYTCQFSAMISSWREAFGNPELPFVFVMLAPDQKANAVADIRQAQLAALNLTNTGVVSAIDDGDCTSTYCAVHVRDKQLIGKRLSLVLRGLLYEKGISNFPPAQTPRAIQWSFNSSQCEKTGFRGATVYFKDVGSGLQVVSKGRQVVCGGNQKLGFQNKLNLSLLLASSNTNCPSKGYPVQPCLCSGFELNFDGKNWYKVTKITVSEDGKSISICSNHSLRTSKVTGIRYAMSDWPIVTLYSKEGQPAAPFELPQGPPVGPSI